MGAATVNSFSISMHAPRSLGAYPSSGRTGVASSHGVRDGARERSNADYDGRMTREVRTALLIAAVALLVTFWAFLFGIEPLLVLQYPVLLLMGWGIFDAAYHRDSVWHEADQNKIVWVLVQFIPLVGTVAYYVLVHRTLLDAEARVPRR